VPAHRRITALLAALTTMAGGSFVSAAAADADTDAERAGRGAHSALTSGPSSHAAEHRRHAESLAGALGISEDRLGVVLRELRIERRATDITGARPPVRTAAQLADERAAYAAALAAKVDVSPATVAAALDGDGAAREPGARTGPPPAEDTTHP
jgi:hypothetical protein